MAHTTLDRDDFGRNFHWGVATAAYQIEGAVGKDGMGECIWDRFSQRKGKIKNGDRALTACDFYHNYEQDLALVIKMGFREFRFSIAWSRILPDGTGMVNQQGIDYYNRLIDKCLALKIEPWVTLYHWDLPQALEDRGGWKNREIVTWFSDYARICAQAFGKKVKNWIVLNEPMAVAGLGYTTGLHAPGRKGILNFLPVVHHLALCQAEGGRVLREHVPKAYIGTAISCSYVNSHSTKPEDMRAVKRADALMNRLFIEPALGMGYPADAFPYLANIRKYMLEDDREKLRFNFDFIGLQNYFSIVVRHSYLAPVTWLKEVPASERNVPVTKMGWEVNGDGMYWILKQFGTYPGIKSIIVSENGAAFNDSVTGESVHDPERVAYFKEYLSSILKAKREGIKVDGYFAWTLMDNFEWAEGYSARFGLVYVDFASQKRIVKDSGKWFAELLDF